MTATEEPKPLPLYQQYTMCPKCHCSGVSTEHVFAVPQGFDWWKTKNRDYPHFREHMLRKCFNCNYEWMERPLDE